MRYLVISRTLSNGGDHLIASKLIEVIKREKKNDKLVFRNGVEKLDVDYINSFDAIIIGGGPIYENRLLNVESFPLLEIINEINIPITIVGAGWYGFSGFDKNVYSYEFSEVASRLFNKVLTTGGFLGCRDYITARVLKNNGYKNILMTGCPVWYDYECLDDIKVNSNVNKKISKIAISDPGITKRSEEQKIKSTQVIELIQTIQERFPKAEIIFTFNNGIITKYSTPCNTKIKRYLESQGIPVYDLSNSCEGFSIYNDIDLHIGYRVHSHIYTLSKRIPSILIEEDARGQGINHALGLGAYSLTSFDIEGIFKETFSGNKNLMKSLNNVIDEMINSDFINIENAFAIMRNTYNKMKFQLKKI